MGRFSRTCPKQKYGRIAACDNVQAPTTSAVHNSRRPRDHQQHAAASLVNFPSVSSSSKQLGIQFVNETDSIIADGDCRTYSSLRDAPTPTGRRHNRQTPRDYVDESSDSGDDSYDDDVSQLIEFSAVTRRDGSLTSGLTGGVSGTGGLTATDGGPRPGKKTKGRVKIKMEFIENKLRRYTTFSKRKTGIMKKAYELSTLTGTQVMLLVASETGHVYTFATRKLQPMITSDSGKALIQTCLNSPDVIPSTSPTSSARHVTSSSPARSEYTDSPQSTSPHGDQVPLPEASQRRQRNMVTSSTGTAEEADFSYSLTSSSSDAKLNRVVVPNPSVDHVQFNTLSTDQHRGIKRHASTDSEPDSAAAAAATQRSSSTVTVPSEPQSMPIPTPPQLFYKIPGSNQIVTIPALRPSSNGAGALIYQTPQGLLMASPTPLVGALPGSYFLTPTIQQMPAQQAHSGNTTTPLIFTMAQPVGLSSSTDGAQHGENLQACAADLRSNQSDSRKKMKSE